MSTEALIKEGIRLDLPKKGYLIGYTQDGVSLCSFQFHLECQAAGNMDFYRAAVERKLKAGEEVLSSSVDKVQAKAYLLSLGFDLRFYSAGEFLHVLEHYCLKVAGARQFQAPIAWTDERSWQEGRQTYYLVRDQRDILQNNS